MCRTDGDARSEGAGGASRSSINACIPTARRVGANSTAQGHYQVGCVPAASSSITSVDQACDALLSAENELGGETRNHIGERVCPRSGNDSWHHGGVGHG